MEGQSLEPLDASVHERLRSASTATIQTQLFKRGLRNTFMFGLRPVNAGCTSFSGEAFTLRYVPAREDLDVLEAFQDPAHPQRVAVESVSPGQVLVMDCRQDPRAASAGSILITRLMRRGVAAMVTDASVRDSPQIAELPIPVFAAGASANLNLSLHHAVDLQVPVSCAGVAVYPGDVLVGDAEGVVVIPRHLAVEVSTDAAEQEALEAFILERVNDGHPLAGNYPPNADVLAAYAQRCATTNSDQGESRPGRNI